ncbi:uncharacterized protein CG5098-like [Stegodyphus dumicola]|uniref:uncharacterized protein CG5098-like n=1 Tax=Stegodyphus dumicola TaxID=202533 RepID=UPI0015A9C47C|nr:uncharacterized protein CG5098-like [Stegodyphus dumicola]
MQNTSQTFRGTAAPGVNYSDHNYDNHLGVHCQPTGYQPYTNPPYHPIPSPRPHHYGNHQMQQNMPYRHHGGAYAPNQNQYGPNMSQEMYRNHHSGYVGANNRNMSSKPWADNNSSTDLMPPYNQVPSHPQLINNPPQMPSVTSMRSPPHATSNMNPASSQGQQHFRQMQSPAHSPHSWSQAQIPSPGVMHSSRTTPSPLPAHAHARSPGHHSQPFSPPAAHAMNLQPHPPPPENGQIPQSISNASGNDSHNPSNPLHSLQKMVMLEQDSKSILPMVVDGAEQYANPCGSHNYVPEEGASNESKDSSYSTYYNMDENRFESKPNNTSNDSSAYSAVQQVSNCNFPLPAHPLTSENVENITGNISNNNSNVVADIAHSDPNSPSQMQNCSVLGQNHCETSVGQKDCSLKLNECPPHAESAPVFTDQTKAPVSTNSEQALESKSNATFTSEITDPENSESASVPHIETTEMSNSLKTGESKKELDSASKAEVKLELNMKDEVETNHSSANRLQSNCDSATENQVSDTNSDNKSSNSDKSPTNNHNIYTLKSESDTDNKVEKCDSDDDGSNEQESPSIKSSSEVTETESDHRTIEMSEPVTPAKEESNDSPKKCVLRRRKVGASYEEAPSPENELKENTRLENRTPRKSAKESRLDSKKLPVKSTANQKAVDSKPIKELARNPVKVVIHRIRKSDTDTWHVPNNNKESSNENQSDNSGENKVDPKSPNIGPQIIILSPAMSQKKFGFHNSVAANSVITVKDNNTVVETVERNAEKDGSTSKKINASENNPSNTTPDKKRGRPVGSKNKSCSLKKKKGKKGNKKKKLELAKQKVAEVPLKTKKVKIFSGPYVHITGSKENPSSISVINVAQKEEEKVNSKIPAKRSFSTAISRIKKKQVGHLSTLSPTYDAFNRDKTWLCVFCHKGSHHGGLGDLYGPYYIKDKNPDPDTKSHSASTSASTGRGKRRKSDLDDSRPSKRSRQSSGHSCTVEATPGGSSSQKDSSESEMADMKEVWIHEDCAVWCQSISLMSEEVVGLEEAVNEARENICCHCSLDGATVGCWGKSCKEQYHFSCAKETGCQMDIENFSLLCPKHQKKSTDKRGRCQ